MLIGFKERIEQAEVLREKGERDQALSLLTGVIQDAAELGDTDSLVSALGHRIVCYKHLGNLKGMQRDIQKGLHLVIPEADKAVFYLRLADLCLLRGQTELAENSYYRAYTLVPKGGHTEAEYLGHLAEGKAINGKPVEALHFVNEALEKMELCQDIRRFHYLIIVSGLRARKARVARSCGLYRVAIPSFVRGYVEALQLRWKYGMPQRLAQYNRALLSR